MPSQQQPQQLHLLTVSVRKGLPWPDEFPYTVPVIKTLDRLDFTAPVTFLVGENGCGKSTLIEAIACAVGSVVVGGEAIDRDKSLGPLRALAKDFKLTWSIKTKRGFFMRAEDFLGYARRMAATREELARDLEETKREYADRSPTAQVYAKMAYQGQLHALEQRYGGDLDARSHGEGFLALFQSRFVPGGLYLLDEPEAPLSPLRQLSFLVMLHEMVKQNAQFIIATHSPIIMAFPGAHILNLDRVPIEEVAYEDLEHVRITREFLADPERYFRHLLAD